MTGNSEVISRLDSGECSDSGVARMKWEGCSGLETLGEEDFLFYSILCTMFIYTTSESGVKRHNLLKKRKTQRPENVRTTRRRLFLNVKQRLITIREAVSLSSRSIIDSGKGFASVGIVPGLYPAAFGI